MIILISYIAILFITSALTTRHKNHSTDNSEFFLANRQSHWMLVAYGMIGASVSGVSFISVPGMVNTIGMNYLQTCLGFIVGYAVVAFLLLPLYYKLKLTTIYQLLQQRLGNDAYHAASYIFLISKMLGATVRFALISQILYTLITPTTPTTLNSPLYPLLFTLILSIVIWLYTRRGGIHTIVYTDVLQTTCMLAALIALIIATLHALHSPLSIFHSQFPILNTDPLSKQYFWKQFLSGIFIVIVMTGLDQDMMQKNLTCRSLRDAQKDMCTAGVLFLPVNALFLILGILLTQLCTQQGMPIPPGDKLLPTLIASPALANSLPQLLLTLGLTAAAFSSADSALTAMTTTYCTLHPHLPRPHVHRTTAAIFASITITLQLITTTNTTHSTIDTIYTLCAYTYGPLLGLFAAALTTKPHNHQTAKPRNHETTAFLYSTLPPLLCYILNTITTRTLGYTFGYELLIINALITFIGYKAIRRLRRLGD